MGTSWPNSKGKPPAASHTFCSLIKCQWEGLRVETEQTVDVVKDEGIGMCWEPGIVCGTGLMVLTEL